MNKKLNIALQLLNAIEDLELSPEEVEVLTEKWLSAHPSVSAKVGDKISALSSVKNIAEEVDKLLHLLSPDTESPPTEQLNVKEESPLETEELLIVEEPSPAPEPEPVIKTEPEPKPEPEPSPTAETAALKSAKGYSKYGKKLGRPPRPKTKPDIVEPKPEEVPAAKVAEQPLPPVETAAETPIAEPPPAPSKEEPTVSSEPASEEPAKPSEPSKEEIAALQYGKTYELDAIYELNGFYVRTNRLMDGMAHPVGVVVPYTENDNPGELLIRYCDEHAVIPIRQAAQYAKYKLVPYYGRRWRLKEGRDDARIKNSGQFPVLNTMLKKMGGDELKGNYFDGRSSYIGDKYDDNRKIRYVCDIFTPNNNQP